MASSDWTTPSHLAAGADEGDRLGDGQAESHPVSPRPRAARPAAEGPPPEQHEPCHQQWLQRLEAEPWAFGFYQAMRLLECAHPRQPRLGKAQRPSDEPVRLRQEPSLAFAPSTFAEFTPGEPARMTTRFFGLFGPNGPLPLHLTEFARDRLRNSDDPTLARFADLFHHRLMCLFYRAWADAEPAVSFDRPSEDRFSDYVTSLFGLGLPALRNRDALPDLAKLQFAGRFAGGTKTPEGLRAILAGILQVPVALREFVGHWMEIPLDCRWFLGRDGGAGRMGVSATIGDRVWDCQSKFRIIIGPLRFEDYQRLLPGGELLRRIVATVRNYLGYELDWDAQLILQKNEVPAIQLGKQGQLGWTSWLLSHPAERNADDLHLSPEVPAG